MHAKRCVRLQAGMQKAGRGSCSTDLATPPRLTAWASELAHSLSSSQTTRSHGSSSGSSSGTSSSSCLRSGNLGRMGSRSNISSGSGQQHTGARWASCAAAAAQAGLMYKLR